jgi:hypothetical protein
MALLEASMTGKLGLFKNAVNDAFEEAGRIILALVQEFYTLERMVRISKEGITPQFVPFSSLVLDDSWNVHVESMPSTPTTRQARFQQAIQLYTLQLIDKKAVLDLIDFPNRDKILQRMSKAEEEYMKLLLMTGKKPTLGKKRL